MTRLLRHTNSKQISYKDPSSDEEDVVAEDYSSERDELARSSASRHRSTRPARSSARTSARASRHVSYQEPPSDVESVSEDDFGQSARPAKRRRVSVSADELAGSPTIHFTRSQRSSALEYSPPSAPRTATRRASKLTALARSPANSTPQRASRRSKHFVLGGARPARRRGVQRSTPVPTDGKIPKWTSLPYDIWCDIFRYAAEPLRESSMLLQTPSVTWLINSALVCKTFLEPALSALYEEPPLSNIHQPHQLLDLLKVNEDSTMIPYRRKVKRLRVEVRNTLQYTAPQRGLFSLKEFVERAQLLREIDITDITDRPPFRARGSRSKYAYSDELFLALDESEIRLRSWRWNGNMLKDRAISDLKRIHAQQSFASIQNLTVSQLKLAEPRKSSSRKSDMVEVDTLSPETLHATFVDTLKPLSNLRSLRLECITAGDFDELGQWNWIRLLPTNLEGFAVVNASYLDSDTLTDFLVTHGSNLRDLELSHNQLMDLRFLTILKATCPRLERLKMDCTYYSSVELDRDTDPLYESLLDPESVPTWPSSLQEIHLTQLRKWNAEGAATLFTSLIESAEDLPNLRRIIIKANLSVSWRERAQLRDAWIHRMQFVFSDRSPLPTPQLASFKAFRHWKSQTPTRSHPIDERARLTLRSDITDDDEFLDGKFVQGRCSLVDVNVDNLRPAEHQFTEQDFMDSEQSGDEDWHSDVETSSPQYAW